MPPLTFKLVTLIPLSIFEQWYVHVCPKEPHSRGWSQGIFVGQFSILLEQRNHQEPALPISGRKQWHFSWERQREQPSGQWEMKPSVSTGLDSWRNTEMKRLIISPFLSVKSPWSRTRHVYTNSQPQLKLETWTATLNQIQEFCVLFPKIILKYRKMLRASIQVADTPSSLVGEKF